MVIKCKNTQLSGKGRAYEERKANCVCAERVKTRVLGTHGSNKSPRTMIETKLRLQASNSQKTGSVHG